MVTPTWVYRPESDPKLVHVNATATGGGVAELLHGLVPAQATAGATVGWAVIGGDARFFAFTKRLHHLLHDRADPAAPEPDEVEHYRSVLAPQGDWLAATERARRSSVGSPSSGPAHWGSRRCRLRRPSSCKGLCSRSPALGQLWSRPR